MSADLPTPARGRPRDPRRDAAIRDAAIELLAECGYERMSVDAVAARAGVSKPTIYRRWAGKGELVGEAIRCQPHPAGDVPDTGSLRGDLLATVRNLAGFLTANARLVAGVSGRLQESPALARIVREHSVGIMHAHFGALLERAEARGEIPSAAAVPALWADVAPAVIHSRVLFTGAPVDDAFVEELVDHVLLPVVSHPSEDPK